MRVDFRVRKDNRVTTRHGARVSFIHSLKIIESKFCESSLTSQQSSVDHWRIPYEGRGRVALDTDQEIHRTLDNAKKSTVRSTIIRAEK